MRETCEKRKTAPRRRARGTAISLYANLEANLGSKLDAARPATTQEGIPYAHVAGSSER
jgi:hypothetical protein